MTFGYLLQSFLIGFLFSEMLERRFPDEFRNFITSVTFNTLYLYSKLQIYFARANRNFNDYIKTNPTLFKIKTELDNIMKSKVDTFSQYIKNGTVIDSEDACNSDFILVSWLGDDKKCYNKKILYDLNDPTDMAEFSDIKFMLVEIEIGENKSYKVDFKTDTYNFYLVGNRFTKQFFLYYLKQILYVDENISDTDKFILKIIDHNVNRITVDFTDKNESLILEKNGYKISITNCDDN